MQDDLSRAQHYRTLAAQMIETAKLEPDEARRKELVGLANQYDALAAKLVQKQAERESPPVGGFKL